MGKSDFVIETIGDVLVSSSAGVISGSVLNYIVPKDDPRYKKGFGVAFGIGIGGLVLYGLSSSHKDAADCQIATLETSTDNVRANIEMLEELRSIRSENVAMKTDLEALKQKLKVRVQ